MQSKMQLKKIRIVDCANKTLTVASITLQVSKQCQIANTLHCMLRYEGSLVGEVKNVLINGVQNNCSQTSPSENRYCCKIKAGLRPGNEANTHPISLVSKRHIYTSMQVATLEPIKMMLQP